MKISFPIEITAADTNKRTLTGRIVSWNEEGSTSAALTFRNLSNYCLNMTKLDLWENLLI